MTAGSGASSRLAILKALGDNTRYAIYLELARAAAPLSTADIADTLALHPNTVRPHLERMRDVGLLEIHAEARGAVGRPQHRYSLAADAPSLGLEPPTFPLLARMLVRLAAAAGAGSDEAAEVGRQQGRADALALAPTPAESCVEALADELAVLGFDPAVGDDEEGAVVAFTHCPFRDLAEAFPDLVCNLHRGLVEGFLAEVGDAEIAEFHTLIDREPCQVELTPGNLKAGTSPGGRS